GLQHARAPLVLFLDADDVLRPEALETMLRAYGRGGASYVYCDCMPARQDAQIADALRVDWRTLPTYDTAAPAPLAVAPAMEYEQRAFLQHGYRDGWRGGHSVTALVETEAARDVGGFDEALP